MENRTDLFSTTLLQKLVGIIVFFFPIVLFLGSYSYSEINDLPVKIQASLSDYYYTNMRDTYVGMMCVLSIFLFTYRDYSLVDEQALKHNKIGNLASVFAIGVAFFPCQKTEGLQWINVVHYFSAFMLFVTLAFFSLKLFSRNEYSMNKASLIKEKICRMCGYIILTCLFLITLSLVPPFKLYYENYYLLLILETTIIWVFATSWFVKSGTIIKKINTIQ